MNNRDIYDMLVSLNAAIHDEYEEEVLGHEFFQVGRREYPTLLKVWFATTWQECQLQLYVLERTWHIREVGDPVTGCQLPSDYHVLRDEPERYEGPGWKRRMRRDILKAIPRALNAWYEVAES